MLDTRPLTNGFTRWEPRLGQPAPSLKTAVIRVVGHPKYPNSAGSPAAVAPFVARLRTLPGHVFWKDDLSLIGSDLVNVDQIMTPGQVTDTYLLALAVADKGQLATLDRRLSTKAVRHGKAALHVIGGGG